MKHQSQRGVALVITLVMLSVITFLTIAFLAISRRDRASVTTSLNQTDAHLMADTGLERFKTELVAQMVARGDYDLMLTRNYINPLGFDSTITTTNTTNVNYDFLQNGGAFTTDDRIRNIANLFYDPRPPVFIRTNSLFPNQRDFRFYLDYNRNGRFETNGLQPIVIDELGNTNGTANFVGEPEWIGVLQNPEYPHSATNRFIGRYLFLALPISKTLDLNYIHDYTKGNIGLPAIMNSGDGFLRNQGFGSWEINLASFLVDLNTNIYFNVPSAQKYVYYPDVTTSTFANTGDAFNDALSILAYRYGGNYSTPNFSSVSTLFPGNGGSAINARPLFQRDLIDGYGTRPVLVSPFINMVDPDLLPSDLTSLAWAGSDNPRRYTDPQELFDPNKTSPNFVTNLMAASTRTNSYDRYTFSRLLQTIGLSSEPEVKGKININYVNDPTSRSVNTNFVEWTPVQFFTNVVSRLIKDNLIYVLNPDGTTNSSYMFNTNNAENWVHPNFSITNIQVYPTNEYTAQLHRLLQVAANIYDATQTNRYPSVFRPRVQNVGGNVQIFDYISETNSQFVADYFARPFQDRTNVTRPDDLVWGVPVVVGAKKGFPNFSKFMVRNFVQITRNLQLKRPTTNSLPNTTNQMIVVGISNIFAMEAWNSYIAPYTNTVRLLATNFSTMILTNELGNIIWPPNNQTAYFGSTNRIDINVWPSVLTGSNAFMVPLFTNTVFLSDSKFALSQIPAFQTNVSNYLPDGFPLPTWGLVITNRLVYALIDTSEPMGRVIDFVNLDDLRMNLDISKELIEGPSPPDLALIWKTNRIGGSSIFTPTRGILNQIDVSMGMPRLLSDADWRDYGIQRSPGSKEKAIANFTRFMGQTPTVIGFQNTPNPPDLSVQTPFNPTRRMVQTFYWQINDPLVHYTKDDLLNKALTNLVEVVPATALPTPLRLKVYSELYQPWGGHHLPNVAGAENDEDLNYDFRVKDAGVSDSDNWNFPTNKFPNIGWLGRVHRGTPWQTIYLKAGAIPVNEWSKWANYEESQPTNDWKLMDAFTVAPNDNAARGVLSVNQTNIAAWSAVFGGMVALSNSVPDGAVLKLGAQYESYLIQPNSPQLYNIVNDINNTRTNFGGVFKSVGQILATPALSMNFGTNGLFTSSPFLNVTNSASQRRYGVTDAVYEWLPRQLMSLLRLGDEPRFVVYCYGQSLQPANNSLVLTPPAGQRQLFNLCTNYQITGEVVTRTTLRLEGAPQNPKVVIENYNIVPEQN